jgi:hypothetical protein
VANIRNIFCESVAVAFSRNHPPPCIRREKARPLPQGIKRLMQLGNSHQVAQTVSFGPKSVVD